MDVLASAVPVFGSPVHAGDSSNSDGAGARGTRPVPLLAVREGEGWRDAMTASLVKLEQLARTADQK